MRQVSGSQGFWLKETIMFRAVAVSSILIISAVLTVTTDVSAQVPAPDKPPVVAAATPDSAAAFLGDWTLTTQGPNGPGTFAVSVKVDAGKVVGEISSEVQPRQPITDISTSGPGLVLKYVFDYQGTAVPVVVTLTPAKEKVDAQLDFADGAYVMTGTATKNAK
jgi:hypothetical protein